jgi:hypothetical protein
VCCPSPGTFASAHDPAGRSSKLAGTATGSSTHRVCPTESSASLADIVTPTALVYHPPDPFGEDGASEIVVAGAVASEL